jgi:hypothetical protein
LPLAPKAVLALAERVQEAVAQDALDLRAALHSESLAVHVDDVDADT